MEIRDFFRENKKVAIAFSGGTDSAYLLHEAAEAGADVFAYFVKSEFQPSRELEDAERVIGSLRGKNVKFKVIPVSVLDDAVIALNGKDRCYHCKKKILSAIAKEAAKDGCHVVADGTNASDPEDERPGMRALSELGVRSPLREAGICKNEIRRESGKAGLFTADKPAYACLATRICSGEEITIDKLRITEKAEDFLYGLGLRDFRVRLSGRTAKIQVRGEQFDLVWSNREKIVSELKKYYDEIMLDMEERR